MIRTSAETGELIGKLAIAQSKMGAATKASTAQGEKFSYKYADLGAIIDATLEHLNAQGIAVMQHPSFEYKTVADLSEAFVTVTTRLQYDTQWMESDISVPALMRGRFDAQSVGSAITYACRYALQSIFVVPREDDDGQAASGVGSHAAAQALVPGKIAELKKKIGESVPSLFYIWFNESQTAQITGDRGLLKVNEDLLKPLKLDGKLIANGDQLEVLKVRLEERGVSFAPLKTL